MRSVEVLIKVQILKMVTTIMKQQRCVKKEKDEKDHTQRQIQGFVSALSITTDTNTELLVSPNE